MVVNKPENSPILAPTLQKTPNKSSKNTKNNTHTFSTQKPSSKSKASLPSTPPLFFPTLLLSLCLISLSSQKCESSHDNPWDKDLGFNAQVQVSEYPRVVKACNFLFFNNIGDYRILSKQATNITKISEDLAFADCKKLKVVILFALPIILGITFVLLFVLGANITSWVHAMEFCQELFLISTMNIVREPCLMDFYISLRSTFFIWVNRLHTPRNTNYLARIYPHSCYFAENITEITVTGSIIFFLYLLFITTHLFLSADGQTDMKFNRLLKRVDFSLFIRLGQMVVTPFTFYAVLGLRVVAFERVFRVLDYLLAFFYSFFMLGFVAFAVYIINYAKINLEAPKTLRKYGAFYKSIKYERENKSVSNEFVIRQCIKILMASFHTVGYFSPYAVSLVGIMAYGAFLVFILWSFWSEGLYRNIYHSFKMCVFQFIIMGNYIFAIVQVERKKYEIFIIGFLVQLVNILTIVYLIVHMIVELFFIIKNMRKDKKIEEYDENSKKANLNVSFINSGLHRYEHFQE